MRHFLDHYRNIGVEFFLVYDDRSDPEAAEFLLSQPDCTVVRSDHQFGDTFGVDLLGVPRRLPLALKESAAESLLPGRWVLTVDADEFLVLPSAFADLPAFADFLDSIDRPYATAPMVDFYGETLDHRRYDPALSPFMGAPFFDVGPYFYWAGYHSPIPFQYGVRQRLLRMLCERRPERIRSIFGQYFPGPAKSWKIPLLKQGRGITRIGDHGLSIDPLGDHCAALAHFKFTPDLDEKVDHALRNRQYYGGSVQYAFLRAAIELMGGESLLCAETRRFEGPASLETAGHIAVNGPASS